MNKVIDSTGNARLDRRYIFQLDVYESAFAVFGHAEAMRQAGLTDIGLLTARWIAGKYLGYGIPGVMPDFEGTRAYVKRYAS